MWADFLLCLMNISYAFYMSDYEWKWVCVGIIYCILSLSHYNRSPLAVVSGQQNQKGRALSLSWWIQILVLEISSRKDAAVCLELILWRNTSRMLEIWGINNYTIKIYTKFYGLLQFVIMNQFCLHIHLCYLGTEREVDSFFINYLVKLTVKDFIEKHDIHFLAV